MSKIKIFILLSFALIIGTLAACSTPAEPVGIASTSINAQGELVITYTDGRVENLGVVRGPAGTPGQDGQAGTPGQDGQAGAPGEAGTPGQDGQAGEDGEPGLRGQRGLPGADGREVEFNVSSTHIQWRFVGETAWVNLVALSELQGEAGDPGLSVVTASNETELITLLAVDTVDVIVFVGDITLDQSLFDGLVLDFDGKTLIGDLIIDTALSGTVTFTGAGILDGDLEIDAANLTLNSDLNVEGLTTIFNLANNTFNTGGRHAGGIRVFDIDGVTITLVGAAASTTVTVEEDGQVTINGNAAGVVIAGANANLTINGTIGRLTVEANATVTFGENSRVNTLEVDSSAVFTPVVTSGADIIIPSNALRIPALASTLDDFSILVAALDEAGLISLLSDEGPFTVFAPTNDAFETLLDALETDLDGLLALSNLIEILMYHVLPFDIFSEELLELLEEGSVTAETVAGLSVIITLEDGEVFVNGARVSAVDVEAQNGVIHVIEEVLLPLSLVEALALLPERSILLSALEEANLIGTLEADEFVILAPSNEAFAALLDELGMTAEALLASEELATILLYHVIGFEEDPVMILGVEVFETASGFLIFVEFDEETSATVNDIPFDFDDYVFTTNGLLILIDEVLLPLTVSETVAQFPTLSVLFEALISANLVDALSAEGPFTLFAPSNEAFLDFLDAMDISAEALLSSEDLIDVLLYHVVLGDLFAEDVLAALADGPVVLETLNGSVIVIREADGIDLTIEINGVTISQFDILTGNGVIHVLDGVLLPPLSIPEVAQEADGFETLVAALIEAGLVDALSAEGPFTVFAPTDEAFSELLAILEIDAQTLLASEDLVDILLYHVISGQIFSFDLAPLLADGPILVETLGGQELTIESNGSGGIFVNGFEVIVADILASNGVIHAIDGVLLPPQDLPTTLGALEGFEILLAALETADLIEALEGEGPFTLFAPTDSDLSTIIANLGISAEDFLALPNLTDILLYHVVPGRVFSSDLLEALEDGPVEVETLGGGILVITLVEGQVLVNGQPLGSTDILASNGVIHAINGILLEDMVATATRSNAVDILLIALEAFDLLDAFDEGNFMLFAPSDEAFEALLAEFGFSEPEELLGVENLLQILLNHVVPMATPLFSFDILDDLSGLEFLSFEALDQFGGSQEIIITLEGDVLKVNGVAISQPDFLASNGIIHLIDGVILPDREGTFFILLDVDLDDFSFSALPGNNTASSAISSEFDDDTAFTFVLPNNSELFNLGQLGFMSGNAFLESPVMIEVLRRHMFEGLFSSSALRALTVDGPLEVTTLAGTTVTVTSTFEEATAGWRAFSAFGSAFLSAESGALTFNVTEGGSSLPWHFQIIQDALSIGTGEDNQPFIHFDSNTTYRLSFTAVSSVEGTFNVRLAPYLIEEELSVGLIPTTFELEFTTPSDTSALARLQFELGALFAPNQTGTFTLSDLALDVDDSWGEFFLFEFGLEGEDDDFIDSELLVNPGFETRTRLFLNGQEVVLKDVVGVNTVIHGLDGIFLEDLVDTASDVNNLQTFVSAVQATEIEDSFINSGPFTVFAPTNEAFAALLLELDMTVEALLADEDLLEEVLGNHVVNQRVLAFELLALLEDGPVTLSTWGDLDLTFTLVGDDVFVNDVQIIDFDLLASNGVIHTIGEVLISDSTPPSEGFILE